MTGFAAEQQDIETAFAAGWASETPIAYENVAFDPTAATEFVQILILDGDAMQMSLSSINQLHRYSGLLQVSIYVKKNTGAGRARALMQKAHDIFCAQKINNLTFWTPYPRPAIDAGDFMRYDLVCNFYRDDLRAQA